MRLVQLEVRGFRAFQSRETFDLDADAVVIAGANGQGKTSLFDAILWGLTDTIRRLGKSDEHLVNRYSETLEAEVKITLRADDGRVAQLRGVPDRHVAHQDVRVAGRAETDAQKAGESSDADGCGIQEGGVEPA